MNNDVLKISNLYDLNETIAAKVFEGCTYPWEVHDSKAIRAEYLY